jgi:hypothetical protein
MMNLNSDKKNSGNVATAKSKNTVRVGTAANKKSKGPPVKIPVTLLSGTVTSISLENLKYKF